MSVPRLGVAPGALRRVGIFFIAFIPDWLIFWGSAWVMVLVLLPSYLYRRTVSKSSSAG